MQTLSTKQPRLTVLSPFTGHSGDKLKNSVGSSCKRNDQFRVVQAADIAEKLAIDDEFEIGKEKNRAGDIR